MNVNIVVRVTALPTGVRGTSANWRKIFGVELSLGGARFSHDTNASLYARISLWCYTAIFPAEAVALQFS